ncbi:hypothetical protein Ae201684P_011536 [Aphanomyces euteiches]|uniref:Uncharacterized protein n=1 Tax=Aphanomyces euteiches TaxID=100861 RepID=A0A6G0XWY1_9STRA|nr:hypothetical protein Ae201684_000580 [Aphanomyces euteiches]KAH9091996.1 hypothetical protein Ae201684P_011536 [Aphanomyces euteiches]
MSCEPMSMPTFILQVSPHADDMKEPNDKARPTTHVQGSLFISKEQTAPVGNGVAPLVTTPPDMISVGRHLNEAYLVTDMGL